jgi:uncharacterized protein
VKARLVHGHVWHRRLRPVEHRFVYPIFQLRFELGREEELGSRLLSIGRFNLFGFYASDHGPRDGSALLPWVRRGLAAAGIAEANGAVWLQTMPRMLGYVFNPISLYFCHDRNGQLRAVLCEVNNTFGDHDTYVICRPDRRPL